LKLKPEVSAGENAVVAPNCAGLLNVKPVLLAGWELSALVVAPNCAGLLNVKPVLLAGWELSALVVAPNCAGLLNVKPVLLAGWELSALVTAADAAAAVDDDGGSETKLKDGPLDAAGGLKLKPTTENYLNPNNMVESCMGMNN